jgi:hypothetical protein
MEEGERKLSHYDGACANRRESRNKKKTRRRRKRDGKDRRNEEKFFRLCENFLIGPWEREDERSIKN